MTDRQKPGKKHLLSAARLDQARKIDPDSDLTRNRGESNGLRIHGVYFGLFALAVLVAAIIVIAIVSAMAMM